MISTCLIGEDSLLIRCAEILLSKGHAIKVIVSSIKKIQDWAEKNQIQCLESIYQLIAPDYNTSFDYIFSIVNSYILPASVMKLAQHMAINYHDSRLPRYAGLNATSWAILSGEKEHGVTWHLMTDQIDQGDIVKQRIFPIYQDDTAFTLNLRCYEFAVNSFQALINDIEQGTLDRKSQAPDAQTYYAVDHPLPNMGFIDWANFSATDIDRLHRALTFGHYKNAMGTLKIYFPDNYVVIGHLEIVAQSNQATAPGVVLSIENNSMIVAAIDHSIKITRLLSYAGDELTIAEFVAEYNITIGFQFGLIKSNTLNRLKTLYSKALKAEYYWTQSLLAVAPHSIFCEKEREVAQTFNETCQAINLRKIFPAKKFETIENILVSAIFIYLYRTNNHEKITAFLAPPFFGDIHQKLGGLFSLLLPIHFAGKSDFSLGKALEYVGDTLITARKNHTYLVDVVARNPDFEGHTMIPNIVISLTDQIQPHHLPKHVMLYFQLNPEEGSIQIYHRFNIDLNTGVSTMIHHLSQHLTKIAIHLISHPHLSITNFSFLPEHEHYKLVRNFGAGAEKYLPNLSIAALVEKQVMLRPKNIAIINDDQCVSYEQLWNYAQKIAHFLRDNKISEKMLIGIYLERSVDMIAALLGILSAHCVYVPVDIKYPLHRAHSIFKEAGVTFILTQTHFSDRLTDFFAEKGDTITCVSTHDILINKKKSPSLKIQKQAETDFINDLAYVIFTSGTTGAPKGVMVTQSNVLNYCYWFLETTYFDNQSIIDFSSSLAFDISVPCTIAPLLAGGAIAICSSAAKTDPQKYLSYLVRHAVTHVEMTPGYMGLLLNYPDKIQVLTQLKYLLLGADAISKDDIIRWLSICPNHCLVNEYGPTEATVSVTSYFIDIHQLPDESSVPIGQPAFNTHCYVLDSHNNLCPIGMAGELHVGGAQTALGYLNKKELSQKKFITGNFNKKKDRLYKTGDMVYWLADGNLQFLGRNDHQIKIAGYRVETAEIETALVKIEGITQAVVRGLVGKFKNNYLKAYLICRKPFHYDDDIKDILKHQLPSYMIPREFCIVSSIPLKESETIDYHALETKVMCLLTSRAQEVPTLSLNFRETVLRIWRDIFDNQSITEQDDFFDIGGDSLIALKIIDEIGRHYSLEIPLIYLFECPNVSQLSNKIYTLYQCNRPSHVPPVRAHYSPLVALSNSDDESPLFLIHPVGGGIFWYKELATLLEGKHTIYGIQDPNIDGHKVVFGSLEEMASYYLEEIKKVYTGKRYRLGGASFGANLAFEMAHQLIKSNETVEFLGLLDGWAYYPKSLMENELLGLLKNKDLHLNQLNNERKKALFDLVNIRRQLLMNYQLPSLKVNAVLFKSKELWPIFRNFSDNYNGWQPYLKDNLLVCHTPGNHETMFFPPYVQILSQLLSKHLLLKCPDKRDLLT